MSPPARAASRPPVHTASRPPVLLSGPGAEEIAEIAGSVPDPELPMVSLKNLGILRAVEVDEESGAIAVTITPTYSGCPAMATMAEDIAGRLAEAGYADVTVHRQLGGDWTSDDLTPAGRGALRESGIAPPVERSGEPVACPLCASTDTEQLTPFGATSCKALFRCRQCREPFEYFKVHR